MEFICKEKKFKVIAEFELNAIGLPDQGIQLFDIQLLNPKLNIENKKENSSKSVNIISRDVSNLENSPNSNIILVSNHGHMYKFSTQLLGNRNN